VSELQKFNKKLGTVRFTKKNNISPSGWKEEIS
jgi:hypothetical protein